MTLSLSRLLHAKAATISGSKPCDGPDESLPPSIRPLGPVNRAKFVTVFNQTLEQTGDEQQAFARAFAAVSAATPQGNKANPPGDRLLDDTGLERQPLRQSGGDCLSVLVGNLSLTQTSLPAFVPASM